MKKLFATIALLGGLYAADAHAQYWDDVPEFVQSVALDGAAASTVTGARDGYYSVECTVAFFVRAGTGASATTGRAYEARPSGNSTAFIHLRAGYTSFSLFASSAGTCYLFRHGDGR